MPSGEIFTHTNMSEFAKIHSLRADRLRRMYKYPSHYLTLGWVVDRHENR